MKHLDKVLYVICLGFYAWGLIDDRFRTWAIIGGNSTFIALILEKRKRKGEPLFDAGVFIMVACVAALLCLQIADYMRK